jgi:hypothetical protein
VARERISACLIVQDEQERLPAALASVAFCDETIVVDGGSGDRTVELARAAGARVIENPWPGFAIQRNVALDAAGGEWILEIDADERVSEQLRASIEALLRAEPSARARMAVCALRNHFLGGPLGPSAKYPAYRARVFRRDAYRHDDSRRVHEGIEPRERPVVLDGDLEHVLAGTLGEALADTWRYARLESLHVARPTLRACVTGIVVRPVAKLAYRTIVDGGWRDGWRGMLKISLDATSDGVVWTLALARGRRDPAREPGTRQGHFGRRPVGPVKVVALAAGGRSARAATLRLSELRAQGLDVALLSTASSAAGVERNEDVPLQAAKRMWPLAVIRALEIETQLRTIDELVPVGWRARLLWHLLPWTLRGGVRRAW